MAVRFSASSSWASLKAMVSKTPLHALSFTFGFSRVAVGAFSFNTLRYKDFK